MEIQSRSERLRRHAPTRTASLASLAAVGVRSGQVDFGNRPAHDVTERVCVLIVEKARVHAVVRMSRCRTVEDTPNRVHYLVGRDPLHANVVAVTRGAVDVMRQGLQ